MFIRLFAYDILDDIVWTVVVHDAETVGASPVLIGEGTVSNRHDVISARAAWRVLTDAAESAYQEYQKQYDSQHGKF